MLARLDGDLHVVSLSTPRLRHSAASSAAVENKCFEPTERNNESNSLGSIFARIPKRQNQRAGKNAITDQVAGLAIRLTEPDVPSIFAHVLPLTGSEHAAATRGRCGGVHRRATGRAGWSKGDNTKAFNSLKQGPLVFRLIPGCSPATAPH